MGCRQNGATGGERLLREAVRWFWLAADRYVVRENQSELTHEHPGAANGRKRLVISKGGGAAIALKASIRGRPRKCAPGKLPSRSHEGSCWRSLRRQNASSRSALRGRVVIRGVVIKTAQGEGKTLRGGAAVGSGWQIRHVLRKPVWGIVNREGEGS